MRILIVNDDGYSAEGIMSLADAVNRKGHDVCVVAPQNSRSGASQSMTFFKKQVLKEQSSRTYKVFSFDGSPADCVKLALCVLYKDNPPDVILSGINSETNIGTEMYYSGTLGAALEGAVNGVKSIALSLDHNLTPNYVYFADYFAEHLDYYISLVDADTPLNINFNVFGDGSIKNKLTFASDVIAYVDSYRYEGEDEDGNKVYMLVGEPHEELAPRGSDVAQYFAGYTVITPVRHGKTDFDKLKKLMEYGDLLL